MNSLATVYRHALKNLPLFFLTALFNACFTSSSHSWDLSLLLKCSTIILDTSVSSSGVQWFGSKRNEHWSAKKMTKLIYKINTLQQNLHLIVNNYVVSLQRETIFLQYLHLYQKYIWQKVTDTASLKYQEVLFHQGSF